MKYRTLLIRRKTEEIPPEQLEMFIKIQQQFREWATEWYKSGFKAPMPEQNPLKYFAMKLKYVLKLIPTNGLKKDKWNVPLPFNIQLRINNEKDVGCGVFIDLSKGEVRIRKWGGGTIVLKLKKSSIKWIKERVEEGGKPVLAMAWVGRVKRSNIVTFNVALTFARDVEPIDVRRVLAVDLNGLHNGVVWGVVEKDKILASGTERPHLSKIGRLQKEISKLDSLCAKKGEYCRQAVAAESRLRRLLREFADEAAKKIVRLARQYKALIVVDAPKDESLREIKQSRYAPSKKIYLDVGRLKKRIKQLAEWYGVPYREARLYSTICPRCEAKMEELPNRRVRCPKCGFEAPRDEVPLMWTAKRFSELTPSFSSLAIALAAF
ncbi:Transposase-like protein [Pyrobaculum oguniense TE7]|uniref:Transposase-like protein n=1 Tax=Pyrobaculum oguniense (strain DSM 13380 / JCM 10595 / TE7) TaxID=698757 RepID=H6QCY0_PYROT|nr:Transposase-like protein [Pyrobaculum oguniense TE7]